MSQVVKPSQVPEISHFYWYVPSSFFGLSLVLDTLTRKRDMIEMTIYAGVVHKEFMGDNGNQHVSRLVNIYKLLNSKKVTHVDTLVNSCLNTIHILI